MRINKLRDIKAAEVEDQPLEIEVVSNLPGSQLAHLSDPHLVNDWLASKSENTRRAYAGDLARFAQWLEVDTGEEALGELVGAGPQGARHLALSYRSYLEKRGLSPSTVNRAIASLRSLVDLARDALLIDWSLNVRGLKARAYRDTSGPNRAAVAAILAAADGHRDARKAARDGALLRMLYGLGLRRAEATGLDVQHVDLDAGQVLVKGKGKYDRAPITLPAPVLDALARWLEMHPAPHTDAPLFVALDRASGAVVRRLTTRSVARALRAHCRSAGVREVAPHAMRHAAITAALDATGGDVRRVRAFSRHAKVETLTRYDDNRKDGAAEVAALVAM